MKKFYMVIKDGVSYTEKKHDTFLEARKEAERLCKKERDKFYILGSITKCEPGPVTVKWDCIPDDQHELLIEKRLDCCGTDGCKTDNVEYYGFTGG